MGKEIAAACLRRAGVGLAPFALTGAGMPTEVEVDDGDGRRVGHDGVDRRAKPLFGAVRPHAPHSGEPRAVEAAVEGRPPFVATVAVSGKSYTSEPHRRKKRAEEHAAELALAALLAAEAGA